MNISKFFYIESISKHQVDFTSEINMQKFEKLTKTHIQFRFVFARTFRNFFTFRSFRNYKKIDQSKDQNYIQCKNVEFEKFSTVYDDLNKIRNVWMQKRENVKKNIHTNQIRFRFDISTFFVYEEFFSCFETNSSFSFESILKNSKINRKYTYNWIMFLFWHFRIFQLSLISSFDNRTIVDKFANFLCMFFSSKFNQSKWTCWIVNNLRLHLKCIRMNHKFSFWFSKTSQKFRNKEKNISSLQFIISTSDISC